MIEEKQMSEWIVEITEITDEIIHAKRMTELVRCKECRYWNERERIGNTRYGSCSDDDGLLWHNCFLREDFFCADGDRRSE